MSGFRGIFLDTIHPLIVKRLDADTRAFKSITEGTPQLRSSADGIQYFQERQVWTRVVPFAIPQTEYTTDPNMYISDMSGLAVPQWRDWVIWGAKAASVHGQVEDQQIPYGSSGAGKEYHSNNVFGWGGKHGLYRRTSEAWDGTRQSGIMNSPLPGIVNLQVSNKGDLGTIRRASFDIKVHNLADLEAIEMMYMVPGLSVLVEWGWYHPSLYVEPIDVEMIKDGDKLASTTLINTEILKKSFGVDNDNPGDPTPLYNLEEAAEGDFGALGPPAGVYDGLLGVVTKFNWTNDGQGGYDCRVDVISPGSLAAGIPAESYNLGGAETIDGEDIPVTDLRTIITSIKKESRSKENNITETHVQTQSASRFKSIKILENAESGAVSFSDTKVQDVDIPPHKLATSEYGIKIELDDTTDPPSLRYVKGEPNSKDSPDYFIGEYKGGEREKASRIYGDRTWWNKIMSHVTEGKKYDKVGKTDSGPWYEGKDVDSIQDMLSGDRCDEIMNTKGYNESYTMAKMEYHWGAAFRAGDYYINSSGKLFVKIQGKWIDNDNDTWDDKLFLNQKKKSKVGSWYPEKHETYLAPKMEMPNQENVALGKRKVVANMGKIPGSTTSAKAAKKYGWSGTAGDYKDKSGQTVTTESSGWGSNGSDPMVVETQTGATVYKRTEDDQGNVTYAEVASIEGQDEQSIGAAIKAKAEGIDQADKESRQKDLEGKIAKDAAITTRASNFGSVTWGGPFDDGKPVAFGKGKFHVGIYAKAYPAFAPPLHTVNGVKQPSELGYSIVQGQDPVYPIGMVAYSETYLSWRFVEDYLLNELYMPKAVQPGLDSNNDPKVDLDTTFRSCNRISDKEKHVLTDDFLSTLNGLIEKSDNVLTDESREREVYHSQHIINHPALRSMNPEVCILPGQESLPPLSSAEGITPPSVAGADQLLDGDGNTPMKDSLADPLIKGDTVINRFAGLDKNGNYDASVGVLRNIMINSDLLEEAATKSDNVRKFCMTVLDKVNKACGEPWSFKMLTNSAIGKISIIDENFTPSSNVSDYGQGFTYLDTGDGGVNSIGVYKFTGIGADNILKDVKIQSKIPNELQTMAYYSTLGTDNTKGSSIQMFNMYRTGIVDRLRSISSVTILGNNTGSAQTTLEAEAKLITAYSDLLPQTRKNQSEGLAKNEATVEGEKVAKQYIRRFVHGDTLTVPGYRPPIPIDVSLSLHGVSGIYMGNAVMLKTINEGGILPSRYQGNVALQATSVDHSINAEGWTTEIGTLMRPLADVQKTAVTKVTLKRKDIETVDPTDLPIGNPFGSGNRWRVSSQFGNAEAFRKGSHGGLDIAAPVGTLLVSCLQNATLRYRKQSLRNFEVGGRRPDGYGWYLELRGKGFGANENTKYIIHYGHLSAFRPPGSFAKRFSDWDSLAAYGKEQGWSAPDNRTFDLPGTVPYGTMIAEVGGLKGHEGAGTSTGPHLHITIKDTSNKKLDPQLLVQDYYVAPGGGANDHKPNRG